MPLVDLQVLTESTWRDFNGMSLNINAGSHISFLIIKAKQSTFDINIVCAKTYSGACIFFIIRLVVMLQKAI